MLGFALIILASTVSAWDISASTVLFMPMNNTNATSNADQTDYSGNGHVGENYGVTTGLNDAIGTGVGNFKTDDAGIDIIDTLDAKLFSSGSIYTIIMQFNHTTSSGEAFFTFVGGGNGVSVDLSGDGHKVQRDCSGAWNQQSGSINYNDGALHTTVVEVDLTAELIDSWVDGVADIVDFDTDGTDCSNTKDKAFGWRSNEYGDSEMDGNFYCVIIVNRSLTAEELAGVNNTCALTNESGGGSPYVNTAPTLSAYDTAPDSPPTGNSLTFNITCQEDNSSQTITGYVQIYNESVAWEDVISSTVTNNTNTLLKTVYSGNTTIGEEWSGEYWCGDGTDNTTKAWDNVTIQGLSPVVTANVTSPGTVYTDTTSYLNLTCTDSDTVNITAYVRTRIDDVVDEDYSSIIVSNNTNTLAYTYLSGNYTKGEVITFEYLCSDGNTNTTIYNTSGITVSNTAPVLSAIASVNISHSINLSNQTVCTDADYTDGVDTLYYWDNTTLFNINGSGYISDNPTQAEAGVYNVLVTCGDLTANSSQTFEYEIYNHAPTVASVSTAPVTLTTQLTSYLYMQCTDVDDGTLTYYTKYYVNGSGSVWEGNSRTNNTNATEESIAPAEFSKGDEIIYSYFCGDGNKNSTITNHTTITVQNTAPTLSSVLPSDNRYDRIQLNASAVYTDVDSDAGNCSLYVNNTLNQSTTGVSTGSTFWLQADGMIDGESYSWYLNCTDGTSVVTSSARTYEYDTTNPTLIWVSPESNNSTRVTDAINLTVRAYDTNLFRVNFTCKWANGSVLYANYSGNLTGQWYNISQEITGLNDNQVVTCELSATDDHTYGSLHGLEYETSLEGIRFYKGNKEKMIYFGYYNNGEFKMITPQQRQNFNVTGGVELVSNETEYKFDLQFIRPAQDYPFGFLMNKQGMIVRNASQGHFVYKSWYFDFIDMIQTGFPISMWQNDTHIAWYSNTQYCPGDPGTICVFDPVVGGTNNRTEYAQFEVGITPTTASAVISPGSATSTTTLYGAGSMNGTGNLEFYSKWYLNGTALQEENYENYCYQETANVSTACGGLATGSYSWSSNWKNVQGGFDGDIGTDAEGYSGVNDTYYLNITYSVPVGYNHASLSYRIAGVSPYTFNVTVPDDCFVDDEILIEVITDAYLDGASEVYFNLSCHNGTGFELLATGGTLSSFYEEWMYWFNNISDNTLYNISSFSSDIKKGDEVIFSVLGNQGNYNATSWVNSSTITVGNTAPVLSAVASVNMSHGINLSNQTVCTDIDYTDGKDTLYYWDNTTLFDINSTGFILDDPVQGDAGTYNILITCGDGTANSTQVLSYTITNSAPVLSAIASVNVSHSVNLSNQTVCTDVDSDTLSYWDNTTLFNINSSSGLISDDPTTADTGTHNILITCGDGEYNDTEVFSYTVYNNAPTNVTATVSPTPASTNANLTCNYTYTDTDGDSVTPTYDWYKNGTVQSINSAILYFGNTTDNELWSCSVNVSDGFFSSSTDISLNVTIGDELAPVIQNWTLSSSSITIGSSTTISTYCDDADSNLAVGYPKVEVVDPNTDYDNYTMTASGNKYVKAYTPALVGTYYMTFFCQDESGNMALNRSVLQLTVSNTPNPTGGSGGSTIVIDDNKIECNVSVSPELMIFREAGIIEVNINNEGSSTYAPIISITGELVGKIGVTNTVTVLPDSSGEFGVQYKEGTFLEGDSVMTLTDVVCKDKEIYIKASTSPIPITIIESLFDTSTGILDFFKQPVFSPEKTLLREKLSLLNIAVVMLLWIGVLLIFMYAPIKQSVKQETYGQLIAWILFLLVVAFVLTIFTVTAIRYFGG